MLILILLDIIYYYIVLKKMKHIYLDNISISLLTLVKYKICMVNIIFQ